MRAASGSDVEEYHPTGVLVVPVPEPVVDRFLADEEPTVADLNAIEDEWPLIAAELDLVSAEIRVLTAEPHPSDLDWRRLRRAETRVGQEMRRFYDRHPRSDIRLVAA